MGNIFADTKDIYIFINDYISLRIFEKYSSK